MTEESLLEFPCDFPIKAMGHYSEDFPLLILDIINRHTPEQNHTRFHVRESRNGRYQSITVTVHATSRAQLDAIYQDLSTHERVVMAL